MSGKYTPMNDTLYQYFQAHSLLPHSILEQVEQETRTRSDAIMQINRNQGAFMYLLVKAIGAKRLIEVGTFTGYSAISMASALPSDGRLYAFDIDPETSAVARRFFDKAGLNQRIDLRVGDAKESLRRLLDELGPDACDLAFIDADKTGYQDYYEMCLRLIRPGGILLLDNAIFSGTVTTPGQGGVSAAAIRELNERVRTDQRVEACLLPIADGLYMVRKR